MLIVELYDIRNGASGFDWRHHVYDGWIMDYSMAILMMELGSDAR